MSHQHQLVGGGSHMFTRVNLYKACLTFKLSALSNIAIGLSICKLYKPCNKQHYLFIQKAHKYILTVVGGHIFECSLGQKTSFYSSIVINTMKTSQLQLLRNQLTSW